jgi:hypothetical protein
MKKFLIFFITILSSSAFSATITVDKFENSDVYFIAISGIITPEDSLKFYQVTNNINKAFVVLASTGGSVLSSLDIGRQIKKKNYLTAVPDNTLCASACALIWLAGSKRFAEETSFIGFHAAYIYKDGKQIENGAANALVGSYLNTIGLNDNAIVFITKAPPQGIEKLDRNKGQILGISFASLKDTLLEITDNNNLEIQETAYDPIKIVTKFYNALSLADGSAASALVIPEKRGIGSFNEKNISSFYRNMKIPLKIISLERMSDNFVKVHYKSQILIVMGQRS